MKISKKQIMKLGKMFSIILFTGAIFVSCSKDKDGNDGISRDDFGRTYFDVSNGEFSGRALPSSNSSDIEIDNIRGNATVLAGGANNITVQGNEAAREVVVGVQGQDGFFTIPMTSAGASRGAQALMEATVSMLISQHLESGFTLAIGVGDGNGNFGTFETMEVDLLNAGTGKLQISMSWDQPNDVDLHVIEPNGERIYYGNRRSDNGGQLDVDSNAACGIDNINNENITYEYPENDPSVTIENGEYVVEVDLWSNCNVPSNTTYTVVTLYDGRLITPTSGSNPYTGTYTPDGERTHTAMKFNINGTATKGIPAEGNLITAPKAVNFNFDKNNKVFENFSVTKE